MIAQFFSGGLDSYLMDKICSISDLNIFMDYGQMNSELEFAKAIKPELRIISLPPLWKDQPGPEFKCRNWLFIAAACAKFPEIDELRLAFHATYHGTHYPDCTVEFCNACEAMLADNGLMIKVVAPIYYSYLHQLLECVDHLPPLQSCNVLLGRNCGKCPKCLEIKAGMLMSKKSYLWDEMNRR